MKKKLGIREVRRRRRKVVKDARARAGRPRRNHYGWGDLLEAVKARSDYLVRCPVCGQQIEPWDMTVMEDGIWIIEACESCAEHGQARPEVREVPEIREDPEEDPGSQLNLFGGEQ